MKCKDVYRCKYLQNDFAFPFVVDFDFDPCRDTIQGVPAIFYTISTLLFLQEKKC